MSDITQTALQDCLTRKRELAAEVDRLRAELAKAQEQNVKWEKATVEVYDQSMQIRTETNRDYAAMKEMTLWAHLRTWWAK